MKLASLSALVIACSSPKVEHVIMSQRFKQDLLTFPRTEGACVYGNQRADTAYIDSIGTGNNCIGSIHDHETLLDLDVSDSNQLYNVRGHPKMLFIRSNHYYAWWSK